LSDELEALRVNFYQGLRTVACPLVVNDHVTVHTVRDSDASTISIEGREPLKLLIEFSDGSDQIRRLSELRVGSVEGGMTLNERLFAASMTEVFGDAVRRRDRSGMMRILRLLGVAPPEATADPILQNPGRYGYQA